MKNRFIIAVLSTTLLLSGCACANNKEKKDEKVVHKKKEKKESKQDAVNQPEEAEIKPVVDTNLSDLYTDVGCLHKLKTNILTKKWKMKSVYKRILFRK